MNQYLKLSLLATTVGCLSTAGAAVAQEPVAANAEASIAASAQAQTTTLPDVIVTAQRRSEKLRDVPIAITALNAEALSKAGVTNTMELSKLTPGVIVPLYGAFVLPSIRGISSNGAGVGDSPNVAVYVDGVYQANQSSQLADLPDVQSVQILKGPQGTLYGQNAAGGAIIVDTIAPSFNWKGKASLGYGNFDDKTASGYVTGPLRDTLAFALSGAWRDRRGVNRDLLRGGHDKGLRANQIRGKLLWQPTDATSLTLAAYHTERNDTGIYSGAPLNGNSLGNAIAKLPCNFGGLACLNLPLAVGPHEFAMNPAPDSRTKTTGVSLLGAFRLGELGTLNTVTSYHRANIVNFSDVDGSPVNAVDFYLQIREKDYIQELNFISNKFGRFTFTSGLFYMKKTERYTPQLSDIYHSNPASRLFDTAWPTPLSPVETLAFDARYEKESYAGYLEANYDITDQLTFTAAGRYSYEKARAFNQQLPLNWKIGDPQIDPAADPRGAFTFKKFTPRFVLRYKPDEANTLYASYSKGFKSGYINTNNINNCIDAPGAPRGSCIDPPVRPETVDSYEVGYKGRLGDQLDLKLSAFHSLYKDVQVFVYNPPASTYQNAASGKIDGAEFEATFHATPDLMLNAGAAYLRAKYSEFPSATVYVPNGFGNTLQAVDVSGAQLMRTPKWTANGSINYTHDFASGEAGAYLGANYTSAVYYDPLNRVRQKAYALVDAELSYSPAAIRGMRLVLWGKNLTNHDYLQSVLESQLADSASYGDPRTYGVRVEYTF